MQQVKNDLASAEVSWKLSADGRRFFFRHWDLHFPRVFLPVLRGTCVKCQGFRHAANIQAAQYCLVTWLDICRRVMVTHNHWCISEWCPQNGSANFRQLDNDCRIQPSLLHYLLQDEQILFWIVSLFPFAFFVLWFFRVLRVPSGRLLLLGPLAGAANDSVEDLPPADPRLCPFEPPTPQWSLGWSIRMHKGQRCENFLKTQQILILDMDDILDIWI